MKENITGGCHIMKGFNKKLGTTDFGSLWEAETLLEIQS